MDVFRFLNPDKRETSYVPFRQRVVRNRLNDVEILGSQYSRARLDFFLISVGLLKLVSYVKYEDRLGRDFDHKEVYMKLGGGKKVYQ